MSQIWFSSDWHFGHANIYKHRPAISSEEENRERIKADYRKLVGDRDTVFLMGDICFLPEHLPEIAALPGKKVLIRGNHDTVNIHQMLQVFSDVWGLLHYKRFWLSHAPVHPNELRKRVNIHGHVHYATVDDPRYFNCCVENLWDNFGTSLVNSGQVREEFIKRKVLML